MAKIETLKRRLDKAAGMLGEVTLRPVFHLHSETGEPLRYVTILDETVPELEPVDVVFTITDRMFYDLTSGRRFTVLEGGRGSGKSYGVASFLVARALLRPEKVLCVREIQISMMQSSKSLLEKIIRSDSRLLDYFEIQRDVILGKNGSEFQFRGLRDHTADAIRSFEGVTLVWPEESQNLTRKSWDILVPTIRTEDSQIFATMNRKTENDVIYRDFIIGSHPDATVGRYLLEHNPWASETLKRDAQQLKLRNYDRWLHVYGGEIETLSDQRIFDNWQVENFNIEKIVHNRATTISVGFFGTRRERMDRYYSAKLQIESDFYFGVDFGFRDPTAGVFCYRDPDAREIFILDEIYRVGLDVHGIADLVKDFLRRNGRDGWPVYCDSSRPEIIAELSNRYAVNALPSTKTRVKDGIDMLKGWKIFVKPDLENTIRELGLYAWKTNANGDIVPEPEQGHDHIPDSLRYALGSALSSAGGTYEILENIW